MSDSDVTPDRATWRIGNAPISYGVYGSLRLAQESIDRMLAEMAAAGYHGTELGPPGFIGTPSHTRERLAAAGLDAVAAYVPIHFTGSDEEYAADIAGMHRTFEELQECGGGMAILADEGSDLLLANPVHDPDLGLDDRQWATLVTRLGEILDDARAHGLPTSYHPHVSTYVESPAEIQRLLDDSEVTLAFDTGHIHLAGGDIVALASTWAERISHIHLKDVVAAPLLAAKAAGREDFNTWWADVSVPLGQGDVPLAAFMATLGVTGYHGWLVVEQDRAPVTDDVASLVEQQQRHNFQWVERHLPPA